MMYTEHTNKGETMKTNLNQNSRLLEAKNPVHIEHLDKSELKPAYLQNSCGVYSGDWQRF